MDNNAPDVLRSSVKALIKMVSGICKKPESQRLRKLRMQNMIIRKFVIDVAGAMDFLKAIGFARSGEGNAECLCMKLVNQPLLQCAVELLESKLLAVEQRAKDEPSAPGRESSEQECQGGCGLLGHDKTDGYCASCYEQYHLGEVVLVPHVGNVCYGVQLPALGNGGLGRLEGMLEGAPSGVLIVRNPPPPSAKPRLCMNRCGRVRVLFMGMCRECWQEKAQKERGPGWRGKFKSAIVKLSVVYRFRRADRLKQKNKKRCWSCNRRVGVNGIQCRCGFIFCGQHRYPYEHECKFDHKGLQKQQIRAHNPHILKKKLDRID